MTTDNSFAQDELAWDKLEIGDPRDMTDPNNENACLPNNQLLELVQGAFEDAHLNKIANHLSNCNKCSERYFELLKSQPCFGPIQTVIGSHRSRSLNENLAAKSDFDKTIWPPAYDLLDHPRWEITDLLGSGGMGMVYLAKSRINRQNDVAIKLLHPTFAKSDLFLKRFEREVSLMAEIEPHPNVVKFLGTEKFGNAQLLVMEFVPGISLRDWIDLEYPNGVSYEIAVDLVLQLISGLEHVLASANLVHRDLTCSNLIIDSEGGLKILDFGLAKSPDSNSDGSLTTPEMLAGTASYCSPEHDQHFKQLDFRSDQYSVGCVLFELLTGQPVFGTQTLHNNSVLVRLAHHNSKPRRLTTIKHSIPAELDGIVQKMLSKRAHNRFGTYADLAAVLLPFASNAMQKELASAKPEWIKQSHQNRLSSSRRKAVVLSLIAAAIIGCGFIVFSLVNDWEKIDKRPTKSAENFLAREATVVVGDGNWAIENERLIHTNGNGEQWLLFGSPDWKNYDFSFEVMHKGHPTGVTALFRSPKDNEITLFSFGWIDFRTAQVRYRAGNDFFKPLLEEKENYYQKLNWEISSNQWYQVSVSVRDENAICSIDNIEIFTVNELPYPTGRVGVRLWRTWEGTTQFKNFRVTDAEGKELWSGTPTLPSRSKN